MQELPGMFHENLIACPFEDKEHKIPIVI
jgi:hypothetical protein